MTEPVTTLTTRSAPLAEVASSLPIRTDFTAEQIELIRRTYGRDLNNDELALFLYEARQRGLDPLMRQIYCVKRFDKRANCKVMTIQVGIDGMRLIAERSRRYAPGPEPTFTYGQDGSVVSATSYVKKQTDDGTWHVVSATARFDDYVIRDATGAPTSFWRKPHIQLAKCAEALAIRKAFPVETNGLYTAEETGHYGGSQKVESSSAEEDGTGVLDQDTGTVIDAPSCDRRTDTINDIRDMVLNMIGLPPDQALRAKLSHTASLEARRRFREITGYEDYRLLDDEQLADAHEKVANAHMKFKLGGSADGNAC